LNGLGRRHLELHESADAIRCWTKSLKIYRNPAIGRLLANAYKDERDFANWEQTLALSVGTDRLEANDAEVHHELADAWMRRGDFERAQPHVDMAAKSDRNLGLRIAIRCAEGREKWNEAEQLVQSLSRQSPDRAADWYFWCVRTGRGDIEAARQLAEESWKMLPDFPSADQLATLYVGQLLSGNESMALLTCQKSFDRFRRMSDGAMIAVLADRQGKSDSRNAVFREFAARWSPVDGVQSAPSGPGRRDRLRKPPFAELANLMAELIANGKWESRDFEFLIVNSDKAAIPWLYYLAGRFLCFHEQAEIGREYLQLAISYPQLHSPVSVLATHALRAEGVSIGVPQRNEVPESLAPAVSLLKHGAVAFQRDDLDKALALLNELCQRYPEFLPGLVARGQIHEARSEYAAAIADYEAALKIDDGYPPAHFQLAWLRADCDQAQFLDGAKAVQHANRFLLKRQMKTSVSLSMLAAAQAQSGQFESAVLLEKDAQRLPGQEVSENYLQNYMNKKPRRRRPPTPLYLSVDEMTVIDYDVR
jgi:tetratricopeptide (TPR) repeat protein